MRAQWLASIAIVTKSTKCGRIVGRKVVDGYEVLFERGYLFIIFFVFFKTDFVIFTFCVGGGIGAKQSMAGTGDARFLRNPYGGAIDIATDRNGRQIVVSAQHEQTNKYEKSNNQFHRRHQNYVKLNGKVI